MGALKDGMGGGTGTSTARNEISNDIIITGTTRIYFRDSGISMHSNADGKFTIAADGTADNTIQLEGNVTIKLADKAGANQLTVKDSDDFPIVKIDSAGNIKNKGKVQRV